MKRAAALCLISLATVPATGCRRSADRAPPPAPSSELAPVEAASDSPAFAVLDVVRDLDSCALGHRGVLLDFGDPTTRDDLRPGFLGHADDEVVEHSGATWLRVRSRTLTASFYWPGSESDSPDSNAYVEARIQGVSARGVAVSIDGKAIGSFSLTRTEARTLVARANVPVTLSPGGHELDLRFVGGSRTGDALAEIDWAHIGTGEPGPSYAAPTRADVLVDGNVGGRSMPALSLHAPGFVRCSGWIPAEATVKASLATVGGGDADVEARLLRDRQPPVVLGTAHVRAGVGSWLPWSVPVTGVEGEGALASVELYVARADAATRVLFGAPQVVAARTASATRRPGARGVVLVVLGSTSAKSLAPWGGPHAAPELARLTSSGTVFLANRASSALASAVMGSILTGLPPQLLNLEDADARLPQGPTTLAEACRQAGVSTAMFTANPTTGAAFGFERGWDTFVLHDPLEDISATRVFDDAAEWIDAHRAERFVVLIHARGGHPPWDATLDELKTMPPIGYLGILEPHRAAESLAKARRRTGHFKEEDRVRAWALYDHALDAHDVALGRLLGALRAAGRDDDTAVLVTGDVAASEAPPVPLVDADALDEPLLATPLLVRWAPSDALAVPRIDAPTGPEDLARTVLGLMGLAPPSTFQGVDLARIAQGGLVPAERPLAATFAGRFAVRWGPFVLLGARDRETRMCDLSLDPTCVADVRATSPLALEPIHRWAVAALAPVSPRPYPREGAVLDPHTKAALTRWGRVSDDKSSDDNSE